MSRRNDEEVDRIVECLKIMRSLDQFALPDGILRELAQTMIYDTYRMRDRVGDRSSLATGAWHCSIPNANAL